MSNARLSVLQARAVKDKRITDAQFRTLAALGMYADEDGWCWPSLKTLGNDLSKSKQAVGRDTIALRKLGYLEVKPQFKEDGSRRSNLYRLKFDLPPRQPDVDTPSTNKVDTPSTSEVDVNVPVNDPKNNMPLDWKIATNQTITENDLLEEKLRQEAPRMFEKAFGFGKLPWDSTREWEKFKKFVIEIHRGDPLAFGGYVVWRGGDGKFTAMSNKQIRQNPAAFMDTGWPEFASISTPTRPAIDEGELERTRRMLEEKEKEFVPMPAGLRPKINQLTQKLNVR